MSPLRIIRLLVVLFALFGETIMAVMKHDEGGALQGEASPGRRDLEEGIDTRQRRRTRTSSDDFNPEIIAAGNRRLQRRNLKDDLVIPRTILEYRDECTNKVQYGRLYWATNFERFNETGKILATLGNFYGLQNIGLLGGSLSLVPCGGSARFCLTFIYGDHNYFATSYAKGQWVFAPPPTKKKIKFHRMSNALVTSGPRYFASSTEHACERQGFKAILVTGFTRRLEVKNKRNVVG